MNYKDQGEMLKKWIAESNTNFKILKKVSPILQLMLKAATKDKKSESYFKKQLNEILPKGEALNGMRVDSI